MLTGGRVTAEDAYAYSKFARVALGTNDIDFRARPLSAEEADVPRRRGRAAPRRSTYADLETATTVVLAGLEPEDEAGTIFLRLRKAALHHRTRVVAIAPYATRGLRKMNGHLVADRARRRGRGARAARRRTASSASTRTAVILVGERLATSPGALTAAAPAGPQHRRPAGLGPAPGRRPRRASRPAACPTCCPAAVRSPTPPPASTPPPPGASTACPRPPAATPTRSSPRCVAGELGGLVIGGVDPDDTADPAATRAAIEAASFVVALELRETDVTRAADVVFPVAPVTDKAGTFVTWEGRPRPFDAVFTNPASLPDLRDPRRHRRGAGAARPGPPLGFRTVAEARAQMEEIGPWDGERAPARAADAAAPAPAPAAGDGFALATWKQMLDNGSMQDGDDAPAGHRPPAGRPARRARRTTPAVGADAVDPHRRPRLGDAAGRARRPRRRRGVGAGQLRSAAACSPTWPRPAARSP